MGDVGEEFEDRAITPNILNGEPAGFLEKKYPSPGRGIENDKETKVFEKVSKILKEKIC